MDLSISHQHTEGSTMLRKTATAENPLVKRPWTLCNLLSRPHPGQLCV